jgi:tetratricopeptide (TPR) repeat protein
MGGAAFVFKTRPKNPPVIRRRRRSEPITDASKNRPVPATTTSSSTSATDNQQKEEMIEDAIALGNSARDANPPRYDDADRAYKLAAKLEPKDPRPYIGLGNILYDQKNYANAAEAYLKALHLGVPKEVSRAGKLPKGVSFSMAPPPPYRIFINSNQGGELHAYVGTSLIQNGDWANAESEFMKAIAQENEAQITKHAEWYASLGYSLLQQKRYEAASTRFREAIQLDPAKEEYKELLQQASKRK